MKKLAIVVGCSAMFLLATLTYLVPAASSQAPADPQSLVGEWQGQWKRTKAMGRKAGTGGTYHLTIDRVEGNKVYFKELAVTEKARDERQLTGVLNGNTLTYGDQGNFQLTIEGSKMTGTSRTFQGGSEIELTKTK
jgi:hypothetical protein